MIEATELQAAVLRRLLKHLNEERPDVQNIELMNLAGFCRNCLADWYREAALERGLDLTKEEARDAVYGQPFEEWKAKYQKQATPEQLAAFEAAQQSYSEKRLIAADDKLHRSQRALENNKNPHRKQVVSQNLDRALDERNKALAKNMGETLAKGQGQETDRHI